MKKWRNKILSAVLVLSLLLTSSSFAFAVDGDDTTSDNYILIDRTEIETLTPSSQINNTAFASENIEWAFDGGIETTSNNEIWHSNWNYVDNDRYVIVEFKEKQWINKFVYYPRKGSSNGRFKNCSIYVSENGTDWGNAIFSTTEDWANDETPKTLVFDSTYTKYIKIVGDHTYGDISDKFASALEMQLFKDGNKYPQIESQPNSQISDSNVILSVTAEASSGNQGTLSYQWYSFSDASTVPVAVDNGDSTSITVTPAEDGSATYYYAVITETADESIVSVKSDTVYVAKFSEEFKITKEMGLSATASSSYTGNDVSYVIDGNKDANSDINSSKFWETNWGGTGDSDKWIQFDLGNSYYLNKLIYYPRQHTYMNGSVAQYVLYGSNDGENWFVISQRDETDEWTWEANVAVQSKEITFEVPVNVRYVKMIPTMMWGNVNESMGHSTATMAAAEIELFADNTVEDIITTQPIGGIYTENLLTVTAKDNSTYQWYSNTEKSYVGATELQDANTASYDPVTNGLNKYYFVKVTNNGKSIYSDIVYVSTRQAKIERTDGTYFGTFAEAIEEVRDGETIEVLSDVVLSSKVTISESITIKSSVGSNFVIKRGTGYSNELFDINAPTKEIIFENITIDGGAIWSESEDINSTLDRSNVNTGETAVQPLIVLSNGTVSFLENTFIQNNDNLSEGYSNSNNGGAIRVRSDGATGSVKIILDGATIRNNSCKNFGGAIAAFTLNSGSPSEIEMKNAYIFGNYARDSAGAVLADQTSKFIVENGEIYHNLTETTANNRGGGAVWIGNGEFTVNGGHIYSNTSTKGGVAFINGGTANLNGGSITGNTAIGNGGAIYINAGTTNIGQTGNDFALTISGNTAANGSGIYYGGNSSTVLNINAKFEMDDELYLHTNGRTFNVNCDLTGNAPIDVITTRPLPDIATMNTQENAQGALNVIKYTYNNNRVATKLNNLIMTRNESSGLQISKDINTSTLYYKGVENNLYTVAGANTYTWYEKVEGSNEFAVVADGLDSLSNGEHTVYCVATDGTNYMVSDVATITVKDFYPCSKAIAKFKSI